MTTLFSSEIQPLYLALIRLKKAVSAAEAQSDADFLKGQIVHSIRGTLDKITETIQVMDYQGHTGRIQNAECEPVGFQSVDRDDMPF